MLKAVSLNEYVSGFNKVVINFDENLSRHVNLCREFLEKNKSVASMSLNVGSFPEHLGAYELLNGDGEPSDYKVSFVCLDISRSSISPFVLSKYSGERFECGNIEFVEIQQ